MGITWKTQKHPRDHQPYKKLTFNPYLPKTHEIHCKSHWWPRPYPFVIFINNQLYINNIYDYAFLIGVHFCGFQKLTKVSTIIFDFIFVSLISKSHAIYHSGSEDHVQKFCMKSCETSFSKISIYFNFISKTFLDFIFLYSISPTCI